MPHEVKRAVRLVFMIRLLSECAYSIAQLSSRLEVSEATIRRDLVDLKLPPLSCPLTLEGDRWRIRP